MARPIPVALFAFFALLLAQRAGAASTCHVLLLSGARHSNTITLTFRNVDKWPIRRLDFACKLANPRTGKSRRADCSERNASFLPGAEYTVSYAIPGGAPGPVIVTVKSALFADGRMWKPTKHDFCPALTLRLPRVRSAAKSRSPA